MYEHSFFAGCTSSIGSLLDLPEILPRAAPFRHEWELSVNYIDCIQTLKLQKLKMQSRRWVRSEGKHGADAERMQGRCEWQLLTRLPL